MAVHPYIHVCQLIGFITAVFSNSLLLYVIRKKAGTSFGRYRFLMAIFSIYAIVYAIVEVLTLPIIHVHGAGALFYVDGFLKDYYHAGLTIAIVYCGSFALCISLLATQFVYRYIAVCKHHKMYYFEGNHIFLWFIPPLCMFTIGSFSFCIDYTPTDFKRDFYRRVTLEIYDENIDKIPFLAPLYFTRLPDGTRDYSALDISGGILSCVIIGLSFGTCLVCAFKTYKKLNDTSIQMSSQTCALNRQLFWTLGLQTLVPCVTQYIPVAFIFIVPFFEIGIGRAGNLVGVTCCLYPALDPIIAIFMIDKFRNYILGREKPVMTKSSRVAAFESEGASYMISMEPRRTTLNS